MYLRYSLETRKNIAKRVEILRVERISCARILRFLPRRLKFSEILFALKEKKREERENVIGAISKTHY